MLNSQQSVFLGQSGWFHQAFQVPLTDLFQPHLLIVGQTGAGKSTTLQQISRQLVDLRAGQIVFDPTGEFSKAANQQIQYDVGDNVYFDLSQLSAHALLQALDLVWPDEMIEALSQAQTALRINRHLYHLDQILDLTQLNPDDFYANKSKLYPSQWAYSLNLLAGQSRANLAATGQENRSSQNEQFYVNQLADRLANPILKLLAPNQDPKKTKYDLLYLLKLAVAKANFGAKVSINLSRLKDLGSLQATIMSTAWQELLAFQVSSHTKYPVYLLIDEGHRFVGEQVDDKASGLAQLLREGRKEKLFVAFASQSPLDLPTALVSQFNSVMSHRLANQAEIQNLPGFFANSHLTKVIGNLKMGQTYLRCGQNKGRIVQINFGD
ncbi:ATP-binding protein [Fructobacillus ficulneus]|uniref:AAA+ ATPase domain-containing protein n=1 Tax=Fructobacillus ficulneus TaxID=157463 RepID=A0A0K8MGK9_9LACO|nr:DUF87 domain-containing protein [Fructobacillus ficulneus]GAO99670.1 hypothetical protein FFIC_231570 [Fructobacillus ficulneus]